VGSGATHFACRKRFLPSLRCQYKQVTVLFADLVHSMDIAATVGAERLREIMAELVNCSSGVVQRYGGTVDKFTGDGIMAVFGAPAALEDAKRLAVDVEARDGVTPQLRVGLNSGQVIAGEIGSAAAGYTALGEQVGMAQRMESVAPPGGVMLSESTGRLVEDAVVLGEPELVRIKGADDPVPARRLLGVAPQRRMDRAESTFVGRQWEMGALAGMLGQAINGNGRQLERGAGAVSNSRCATCCATYPSRASVLRHGERRKYL
jgi:adenylate cyclase